MTFQERLLYALFCVLVIGAVLVLNGCTAVRQPVSQAIQPHPNPMPGVLCYAPRCRPVTWHIA